MSFSETHVVAATTEYELRGCLPTDSGRIQDLLNDHRSDFIGLTNVSIFAGSNHEVSLGRHEEMLVAKRNIKYALMTNQQHEAPVSRLNHYTAKAPTRVFVTIGRARIEGSLHLSERQRDPLYLLTQLSTFFPITDAVLSCLSAPDREVPVIFAQKAFIDCFCISAEAYAPAP